MPNSIDDMKSLLQSRGGIARGNRYGVHFNHPNMTAKGRHSSWLQDGRDTWILCTAVTLPGKRISTTEATHNHHLAKKPYSMATDEVTMTFLVTGDYYMKKYFDTWMEMIIDSTGNHYKTMYKNDYVSDVTIEALSVDAERDAVYSCKLINAYPIQLSQIELGEGADGLVELTVTWEYDNWKTTEAHDGEAKNRNIPNLKGFERPSFIERWFPSPHR